MRLSGEFRSFREEFAAFRAEADRRFAALAETIRGLAQHTEERMERVENRIRDLGGELRGLTLKERYRTCLRRYADLVAEPHILSTEERAVLPHTAEGAGRLSRAEADDLDEANRIVRGRPLGAEGEVYLVVEVSATMEVRDGKQGPGDPFGFASDSPATRHQTEMHLGRFTA